MNQKPAKMSRAIQVTTAFVLLLTAGLLVGSFYAPAMWWVVAALTMVLAACYATAPVAYDLSGDRLIVVTHVGRREFGPVVKVQRVGRNIWWGIRLFGNGGLFAGTGFFWSRGYGLFRAYVTSARRTDMLMVETPGRKVLITPQDPDAFLATATPAAAL